MENKKLPASYRIALGQIKRYFGDSKPTEKEVKKIAVEIAKRNKLDDTEFFMKWSLGQIGTVNEDLDEAMIFSSKDKSPIDLLDIAVKSIKGIIENLNTVKGIKDYNSAKKEAKILSDKVEELYEKYSK